MRTISLEYHGFKSIWSNDFLASLYGLFTLHRTLKDTSSSRQQILFTLTPFDPYLCYMLSLVQPQTQASSGLLLAVLNK